MEPNKESKMNDVVIVTMTNLVTLSKEHNNKIIFGNFEICDKYLAIICCALNVQTITGIPIYVLMSKRKFNTLINKIGNNKSIIRLSRFNKYRKHCIDMDEIIKFETDSINLSDNFFSEMYNEFWNNTNN